MPYVIYSPWVHTQLFLAQTDTEEQAWKLFLKHEEDYQEQPDGTYHGKTIDHDDLQEALETYGLNRQRDGSYFNGDERFASLQEAQAAYGIRGNDGVVTSHGRSYPTLAAALRVVPVQAHRVEIAPVMINPDAPFQVLFTSRDEWDYVEDSSEEDVKKDIISEHRWLANRYERLNQLPEAVAEYKKGLRVATSIGDKISFHTDLAYLLKKMGQLPAAARQFEHTFRLGVSRGNPSQMHQRVAEIYLQLNQPKKALQHYKQIILEDLDDKEIAEVQERIAELQG